MGKVDINSMISILLQVGVLTSSALILIGLVMMIALPPAGLPGTLESLLASGFGAPSLAASALIPGLATGNPISIMELGTLVLLATPITRVIASAVFFLYERDILYVGVTVLVLAMLLSAIFIIGPVEA